MNFWEIGYVFSTPTDIFGPYSTAYFIVFTIGAVISNFFYFYGKYWFKENLLTYTLVNRASRGAAIAFSLGFVFFLCRIARLQPFNARLFLDIALILLVYFTIRGLNYMLRSYSKAKAEWEAQRTRSTKKARVEAPAVVAPSVKLTKPVATGRLATASGSGDAGGDEDLEEATAATKTERTVGLSERGQKRRERKRNRR